MRLLQRLAVAALFGCHVFPLPAAVADQHWLLSIDRWGNADYRILTLHRSGDVLTGRLGDWAVTGQQHGDLVRFTATDRHGDSYRFEGELEMGALRGHADYPDPNDSRARARHDFNGRRLPDAPTGAPSPRVLEPVSFSNEFTAHREPAMVIWPGEVVSTRTIDSGGVDRNGRTRALYGNPQTGPFFVAGARPGDVLAVYIRRLGLNRDYADSLDGFVGRARSSGLAIASAGLGNRVRWHLDRENGVASLQDPPARLKHYTVPLRPMLGGLAVAPDFGFAPASTGDTGRFGGNMDFNGIVEGTTVYLPVLQPGALLYLGDGHAAQGDGETTQWALETSLDVEFSVDVLPARAVATPRIESDRALTTIGQAGSLDDALRVATAGMVQWLEQDYGLDVRESSLILGTAAEYRVVTLAGRNAGMALSLPKARLQALRAETRGSSRPGHG